MDEAINQLEKVGLSREQNKVGNKARSATNAKGNIDSMIIYDFVFRLKNKSG